MLDTLDAMAAALRSVPIYGERVELRRWSESNPAPGIYLDDQATQYATDDRGNTRVTAHWVAMVVCAPDQRQAETWSAQSAMRKAIIDHDPYRAWWPERSNYQPPAANANTSTVALAVSFTIQEDPER